MLSKNWIVRLVLLGAPVLALAAAALFLTFGPGTGEHAQADAPHAGLNFAIGIDYNGDGMNDCGTGVPSAVGDGAPDTVAADVSNTTCAATPGATLAVNVYLMSNGGVPYEAAASHVYYTGGVTSNGQGTTQWTCHTFDAAASGSNFENAGSAIGLTAPCNVGQTNLGLMSKFSFTCSGPGTIYLGHAVGETLLQNTKSGEHREAGPDELTVCGGGGVTDTPTSPPAVDTPTPTATVPGNTATNTPVATTPSPTTPAQPTNTRTPTNTPRPATATFTRTPTPASRMGDVNGDGRVDTEDALWVLWQEAGIIDEVPRPEKADLNDDGEINSIDALFILWIVGGQI